MALFHELHDEGLTMIVVTHDPGIANQADRILRVRDGKIVSDERPAPGERRAAPRRPS